MKNKFVWEILLSSIIITFLIALLNPFDYGMPPPVQITMTISLIVLFLIFIGFVWQEKAQDEREQLHRFIANRFAYITGTSLLVLGIVIQSTRHIVDIWLVATLIAMIIAKLAGVIYSRLKH